MGDRANVLVLDPQSAPEEAKGVYLYTHWDGHELPLIVQRVLKRHARWEDPPYLARMVFSAMIRDAVDGETGYGIGASIGDNEHEVIVLDCGEQRITFAPADRGGHVYLKHPRWISFDAFIEMPEAAIRELYEPG